MTVTSPVVIERRELAPTNFEVVFTVPRDLKYLRGHFPDAPVVPGVVQIKWAIDFGYECLAIDKRIASMEVVKFRRVMQPDDEVTLNLRLDNSSQKLYFSYTSKSGAHSSGRLVLRATT